MNTLRRGAGLLLVAAVVTFVLSSCQTTTILAAQRALSSNASVLGATVNRTAATDQNAFHVLYVVPSDVGADRSIPAAIGHELDLASMWYREQTGGRSPRFFRTGTGAVDVEVVNLPMTRAQLAKAEQTSQAGRFALLRAHLEALGHVAGEADLVYVDFQSAFVCGETVQDLALVYLERPTTSTEPDPMGCGRSDRSASASVVADNTLVTATHELTHAFGAVAGCAPQHDAIHASHVIDGNVARSDGNGYRGQDILFWNPAFYLALDDFDLDADRADYYGHGRAGCADIANAPRWE